MKTKQNYTPGPWQIEEGATNNRVVGRYPDHYAIVAELASWPAQPNEAEANARLISAAPELYEALKSCVSNMRVLAKAAGLFSPQSVFYEANEAAISALSKAGGAE